MGRPVIMPWSPGGVSGGGVNSISGVAGKTVVNDMGNGVFEIDLDDPLTLTQQVNLNGVTEVNAQMNGNGNIDLG